MSLRDKALKRYKKSNSAAHFEYYKQLRNFTTACIDREKKGFIEFQFNRYKRQVPWKELYDLNVHSKPNNSLIPMNLANANEINNFFSTYVANTKNPDLNLLNHYLQNIESSLLNSFEFSFASTNLIEKLITESKSNATGDDGINSTLLKLCCPTIIPYITHIINSCLEQCVYPSAWKKAIIRPLCKVNNPSELCHLRPISILSAISKLLEKIMDKQIRQHLHNHSMLPNTQSGFRPGYSCTTALSNIIDDVLRASDRGDLTVLILLDYSKAFDTINHELLLAILKHIGFGESALRLMKSYLSNRFQKVVLDNQTSNELPVRSGVPQGSVLGPLLYIIYTYSFRNVIQFCCTHFFADDSQLYYSFNFKTVQLANHLINSDLQQLIKLSVAHDLNINPNKSVVMLFGNDRERQLAIQTLDIRINNERLTVKETARNLGLIIDSSLRFKLHVSNLIRMAYNNLKMIYKSRHLLNRRIKTCLCESLVLSHFNYCDSIYGPCLDYVTSKRIQTVQNACLRLIFGIQKGNHVSHKLGELEWLNMSNRRKLHAACLYHKVITTKTPPYLYNKISFRTDIHNINIRFKGAITPPLHKTTLFERSFTYNVAKIYNSLTSSMKNFKNQTFKKKYASFLLIGQ